MRPVHLVDVNLAFACVRERQEELEALVLSPRSSPSSRSVSSLPRPSREQALRDLVEALEAYLLAHMTTRTARIEGASSMRASRAAATDFRALPIARGLSTSRSTLVGFRSSRAPSVSLCQISVGRSYPGTESGPTGPTPRKEIPCATGFSPLSSSPPGPPLPPVRLRPRRPRGRPERPEYTARGTVYVEALRGHDYALRLSNPTGMRIAVALSVDGLNMLDSRRTTARDARKWVLAPYETVVIPGWQVSNAASRKFVFTGERGSYGAALGKTQDLGVIEAVFFRERLPYRVERRWKEEDRRISSNEHKDGRPDAAATKPGGCARHPHRVKARPATIRRILSSSPSPSSKLSDEYAATGMGRRTQFGVTQVDLELETEPAAVVRLRYEFGRTHCARHPAPRPDPSRLARREGARGFEEFCPEVK